MSASRSSNTDGGLLSLAPLSLGPDPAARGASARSQASSGAATVADVATIIMEYMDGRFAEMGAHMDGKFAEMGSRLSELSGKQDITAFNLARVCTAITFCRIAKTADTLFRLKSHNYNAADGMVVSYMVVPFVVSGAYKDPVVSAFLLHFSEQQLTSTCRKIMG